MKQIWSRVIDRERRRGEEDKQRDGKRDRERERDKEQREKPMLPHSWTGWILYEAGSWGLGFPFTYSSLFVFGFYIGSSTVQLHKYEEADGSHHYTSGVLSWGIWGLGLHTLHDIITSSSSRSADMISILVRNTGTYLSWSWTRNTQQDTAAAESKHGCYVVCIIARLHDI